MVNYKNSMTLFTMILHYCGGLVTRIPASRIRFCGCNIQIHMDYRNPVEENRWHGHSLSERGREGQREPDPCLDRLLLLFWAHYIEDGPHLLCTGSL